MCSLPLIAVSLSSKQSGEKNLSISNIFVARADGAAPSMVRLGDQNLRSRSDGLVEVDVPIAEFIKHERYRRSSYYDDIGLIRMARNVE
jgi:hypothetical protein